MVEILSGKNEVVWRGRENGMRGMHISERDSTRLLCHGSGFRESRSPVTDARRGRRVIRAAKGLSRAP